eukprot:TRINITY_DN8765_c0_g1::TRINITY_DN8765_c0_g1_i1::g.23884::m.23884 TRINITY_DN8765_c0_g1::TRINITY_DN8765_c0_g1_i1::g.23884  ORF type:complete len:257 (+),score=49.13 TRINITY_DN8765_c0_g1_i1:112-882(+)
MSDPSALKTALEKLCRNESRFCERRQEYLQRKVKSLDSAAAREAFLKKQSEDLQVLLQSLENELRALPLLSESDDSCNPNEPKEATAAEPEKKSQDFDDCWAPAISNPQLAFQQKFQNIDHEIYYSYAWSNTSLKRRLEDEERLKVMKERENMIKERAYTFFKANCDLGNHAELNYVLKWWLREKNRSFEELNSTLKVMRADNAKCEYREILRTLNRYYEQYQEEYVLPREKEKDKDNKVVVEEKKEKEKDVKDAK